MTAFGKMKTANVGEPDCLALADDGTPRNPQPCGEYTGTVMVCSPDGVELYDLPVTYDVTEELHIREPYSWGGSRGTEIVRTVHLRGAMIHGLHLTPAMLTAAGLASEITDQIEALEPWRNWE